MYCIPILIALADLACSGAAQTTANFNSSSTASTTASLALSPTTASTQSSSSATGLSSPTPDFNFSYIQKSVNAIGQALSADGFSSSTFPKDIDIICENCTGKGYIGAQLNSGGSSADDFFKNGSIDLVFAGITTNVSLDVELQSGFGPSNGFYAFHNYTLSSLRIGSDFNLSVVAKIGIPFQSPFDSPVSFYGGFVFTLPDEAVVTIAVGEHDGITTSGFENATITALPFGYDGAGLTFSVITGLQIQVDLIAIGHSEIANVTGALGVNINIPQANTTFAALEKVNSLCQAPKGNDKVFKYAAEVTSSLDGGLNMTGEIRVGSYKWSPPSGLPSLGWSVNLPSECLYSDSKDAIDSFGATVNTSDPDSVAAGGGGNYDGAGSANGSGSGSNGSASTDGAVQNSAVGGFMVAQAVTAFWMFVLCVSTAFLFA